jgi:hypothetical protein
MIGLPFGSEGGMKPSSLFGLVGLRMESLTGVLDRRGVGGAGRVFPSMESRVLCVERGGDDTLAWRSFSLIRSATVPERRRAALRGFGDEV